MSKFIIKKENDNIMEILKVKSKAFDEGIPHGKYVDSLNGAIQGIAYGRNRYKGPKPPFKFIHTYVFTIYILDKMIDLDAKSEKPNFLNKINGHILQQATYSGKFQSHRKVSEL